MMMVVQRWYLVPVCVPGVIYQQMPLTFAWSRSVGPALNGTVSCDFLLPIPFTSGESTWSLHKHACR
jgi:hypothetical protein